MYQLLCIFNANFLRFPLKLRIMFTIFIYYENTYIIYMYKREKIKVTFE